MRADRITELETGVFTISLDFELIWGTMDKYGPSRFEKLCAIERSCVVDRLLGLFTEFGISATWCTVGHLFLNSCSTDRKVKHPEIVRPNHSWVPHDWFLHDPCATEETAPLFYGRSLIEKLLDCRVRQEIGSHTFSHVIVGDTGCSRATFETELESSVRAARALGIEMRSFAFPRNRVGHPDVLRSHGFTSFRGPEPRWWHSESCPALLRHLGHLSEVISMRTPPVVLPELILPEMSRPEMHAPALWNIPGSMLFTPSHGLRRYIPIALRVRRARKGLDAAARRKRIFHLWFHPTDFAANVEPMLAGLRQVLEHARKLRDQNQLRFLPMKALVPRSSARTPERRVDTLARARYEAETIYDCNNTTTY